MWHTIGGIIIAIFFYLIVRESQKRENEIWRLSAKCQDLETENKKLKLGRYAYNIGDETVYLSEYESKRYDKWHKFYDLDKMEKVGILAPDEEINIITTGILENKTNEQILKDLIAKSKHI